MSESLNTQLHLRRFVPRNYQLPVMDALENAGYKKIYCLWHRRCLSGDSRILTGFKRDGKNFYQKTKKLKDLKVGDKIKSWNEEEKRFESDFIVNIWKTEAKPTKIVRKTDSQYQAPMKCSEEHVFAFLYPDGSGKQGIYWSPLKARYPNSRFLLYSYGKLVGWPSSRIRITNGPTEELYDLETRKNHNFIANGFLVHNSGKDVVAFNLVIRAAIRKVGVYFYALPTYSHARKVIWDGILSNGQKFLDFIPPELIASKNGQEMKITLVNGSLVQLVGSDTASQSLVGTNPQGVVFSEWALAEPSAYDFIRPALLYNQGFALFITTPRGRNHAFEMHEIAKNSSDWFCSTKTVLDTGVISMDEINNERKTLSEDMIQQEYFCSYTAGQVGSYYGRYLDKARLNGQIGIVPWEPSFKCYSAWDLGVHDKTVVIIWQTIGNVVRIIDMIEDCDKGLDHYARLIKDKPYVWGGHFAPHDIKVRELSTGLSRLELARRMGINFQVLPNIPLEDGIELARVSFNKIWIDEKKCDSLVRALESYRREWDDKRKVYKDNPLHDVNSHAADAFRYLCLALPRAQDGLTAQDLRRNYEEAVYGRQSNINPVFADTLNKY